MRIESLTSIRFLAAMMVVFSHLGFLATSESPVLRSLYENVFYEGYIGVTFFFILSGFILSFSYTSRIRNNEITLSDYIISRFARIYPLHILTLLFALPLVFYAVYKNNDSLLTLIPNIFLVQSFIPSGEYFFSGNAPSWSLSNEMFFYLLFPFLLFRNNLFLVISSLAIVLFQITVSQLGLSAGKQHYLIYIFPVTRLLDFMVGILLFRIYCHFKSKGISINPDAFQVFSILLLILAIVMKQNVLQAYRYDLYYILPMSFLIFSFAYSEGKISSFLSTKIFILLGEASFSLYLIHQLVIKYISAANSFVFGFNGVAWDLIFSLLVIIISIVLSLIIYRFYEMTATRHFRKFLLKKKDKYFNRNDSTDSSRIKS